MKRGILFQRLRGDPLRDSPRRPRELRAFQLAALGDPMGMHGDAERGFHFKASVEMITEIPAEVRIFLHHSSVPYTPAPSAISEAEVQGPQGNRRCQRTIAVAVGE